MARIALLGLLAAPAFADLLPEALGEFVREKIVADAPADAEILAEFGFEQGETAKYTAPSGAAIQITAWFFRDDTGALAAFRWVQPNDAKYVEYGEAAGQTPASTWIHFANYVVRIDGKIPDDENVEIMLTYLPRPRPAADPPVLTYVPDGDNYTERRYVLGPASLAAITGAIPPSVAAFHFGAEAAVSTYEMAGGPMRLLLFSYPTPQMARAQIEAFQSLDRVMAKRTGSLIAVIPDPQSADDAERLLARVAYDAEVTMTNHDALTAEQNWAQTIVNIFIFAGALCVLMVVGGLAVAFARAGITQVAPNSIFAMSKDADLTELHLSAGDKPGPNK